MKSNLRRTEGLKRETRNWKLETGSTKLEARNSKLGRRISIFDFPVSSFDFRSSIFGFALMFIITISLFAPPGYGIGLKKKSQKQKDYLADYIARARAVTPPTPTTGGFWTPQSPYSDLASDYKARNINDLIVIQVVESTTAAEDGAVKTARTYLGQLGDHRIDGYARPKQQFAEHLLAKFFPGSERAGANLLRFHSEYQPFRPGCGCFAQRISGD